MPKSKSVESIASTSKLLPWVWFAVAFVVLIFDQWTKLLATTQLAYGERDIITSFFNITLRHNYGVAFSMFDDIQGGQRWPLALVALVVSIAICVWIVRTGKKASYEVAGLALVLGGALGNLYDRVALGYVVDFIEVHYQGHYWPAFNIADSAICLGAGFLLFDAFFGVNSKSEDTKAAN